jgi:exopolyphosphatase / guanosine-5'-triphosphate,3'-diphosphate pyrophosphatase
LRHTGALFFVNKCGNKMRDKPALYRYFSSVKFAAVDIGSNAIRLLISRVMPTENLDIQFKKVEFIRIPLRLGDDVFSTGKISKEKQALFLMTMNAFKLILDVHGVKEYMACATSAMREAKNGAALVAKVQKKFNFKVDIISGDKESELILKSVMSSFPSKGNYVNIDVGGGSTEITVIKDHEVACAQSFPIGSVRIKEGKVNPKVWTEMEQWVKQNNNIESKTIAIGTGGNINKLYNMADKGQKKAMSLETLENLYKEISPMSINDRIYKLKLNPDRADVIDHAASIYIAVMEWAGIKQIYSPNAGLKDGMIMELWDTHKNIVR